MRGRERPACYSGVVEREFGEGGECEEGVREKHHAALERKHLSGSLRARQRCVSLPRTLVGEGKAAEEGEVVVREGEGGEVVVGKIEGVEAVEKQDPTRQIHVPHVAVGKIESLKISQAREVRHN